MKEFRQAPVEILAKESMKQLSIHSTIVGFALFSMFFGAGNIIFPPYVGLAAGSEWLKGFFCYYMADIGLALVAIFAMLRAHSIDKVEGIMFRLGRIPARIMMSVVLICIGPLLAMPRTGATTFSMAIAPLTGTETMIPAILFSILFFGVTLAFSIRESALVELVGKYLTPALVIGLLLMIIVGAISPIAPISDTPQIQNVTWMGISAGYQTLDVMAAIIFGLLVVNALKAKGYDTHKLKFISVSLASLIAGILLLIVYGGLCYLGATVSTLYPENVDKGFLVMEIARLIFGPVGSAILGVVIGLACLTTAIALAGSMGTFFSRMSNGKWSYKSIVIVSCVFSAFVANFGLSNIIALAAPILTIAYPGVLAVIVLSLFDEQIKNDNVFRFAAAAAMAVSFCEVMGWYWPEIFAFIKALPFQEPGFGWSVPAIVAACLGAAVRPKHRVAP